MLHFNAHAFVLLSDFLHKTGQDYLELDAAWPMGWDAADPPVEVLAKIKQLAGVVNSGLDNLETEFGGFLTKGQRTYIGKIRRAVKHPHLHGKLPQLVTGLQERIQENLAERMFFVVESKRADLFDLEAPGFWPGVREKFPKTRLDVNEAALCLGCGRYTATVLHLMRVAEAGVRFFVIKKLKLAKSEITHKAWGTVLKLANKKLDDLENTSGKTPRQKNRLTSFREVFAYLWNVRDAWRNPAAHPDRSFNETEADSIYTNVRDFMVGLAKLK